MKLYYFVNLTKGLEWLVSLPSVHEAVNSISVTKLVHLLLLGAGDIFREGVHLFSNKDGRSCCFSFWGFL